MNKIKKIFQLSIFYTIYFNLKYLPFKQAIKLPIFLFNPILNIKGGKIIIQSKRITTGMIQLGYNYIPPFPKRRIVLHVSGNIIFKGKCLIGNESSIYVSGTLILGDNFLSTYSLKLFCFDKVTFGDNCLLAWDILCMDSSQHQLTDVCTDQYTGCKSKPIQIGNNCWIASKCLILPGTKIADFTSVTANTTLHKDYLDYGTHKLIGNSPVRILKEGVYLKRKIK